MFSTFSDTCDTCDNVLYANSIVLNSFPLHINCMVGDFLSFLVFVFVTSMGILELDSNWPLLFQGPFLEEWPLEQ